MQCCPLKLLRCYGVWDRSKYVLALCSLFVIADTSEFVTPSLSGLFYTVDIYSMGISGPGSRLPGNSTQQICSNLRLEHLRD